MLFPNRTLTIVEDTLARKRKINFAFCSLNRIFAERLSIGMETNIFEFTPQERQTFDEIFALLTKNSSIGLTPVDEDKLEYYLVRAQLDGKIGTTPFGQHSIIHALQTADLATDSIGLKRDSVIALLIFHSNAYQLFGETEIKDDFGKDVAIIVRGLVKIKDLMDKNRSTDSDNFRNLLLTVAEDMRVVLILIADRLNLMREMRDAEDSESKTLMAQEAAYLYAPLAHKLGLYQLKSELEDLSLKYLEHEAYYMIKEKLNDTKRSRDKYIADFITPIEKKLKEAGLKFHIKGRTKSIHSIWQKMKKQRCGYEGIYDLFAIRIILDSPIDKEKMQCWQVYSIVTDMYTPNPKRLRDWLSVPKSNGYESLHTTVQGPQDKWVEIQIRTERMDEIAEHGLAAHWRYKGIRGEQGMDQWLATVREALESNDETSADDSYKPNRFDDDVFVFTPKGDLMKLSHGATILDFAYHIHSAVGNKCIGGRVNGKNVSIKQELHSGDTVEILTQSTQKPNQSWLSIVKSARAKAKIKLALKETQIKDGLYAKELLERRFKNKKLEMEESIMSQLVKKLGFKETTDFYKQIADEKLNPNEVIEKYIEIKETGSLGSKESSKPALSAEEFYYNNPNEKHLQENEDILVIDQNLKGVDYSLAKCCQPIYGDAIFGFVTVNNGIKIHRMSCPNARDMKIHHPYRIVKAQWSGKGASKYSITLRVVGQDDIGILNNITNIISKEEKLIIRNINVDSHDGLFSGTIVIMLDDTSHLDTIIKKLKTVKGVKQVNRW